MSADAASAVEGGAASSQESFAQATTPVINPDVSTYEKLLDEKAARVRALFGDRLQVPLHVQASKPINYRMRAEFRVWKVGEECHFAIFDPQTKKPIFVEQYPLACERINEIMRDLQEVFKHDRVIRHKIFQVEFVASTSGEALVCLVYRKKLDDEWLEAAQRLADKLGIR
jgi:tRNA (uracil-5-)-methyltransferase